MSRLIRPSWLVLVAAVSLPAPARAASGSLPDVCADIVRDIRTLLRDRKQELTINSFTPDLKTNLVQGSGNGVAIVRELTFQLEFAGVKVKPGTTLTLSGTFLEIEDEKDQRQAVSLDVTLFDRAKKELVDLSKRFKKHYYVTNEINVANLLGISVKYPDNGTRKERIAAAKMVVDSFTPPVKAKAPVNGSRIAPGKNSPFAIQIEVAAGDPDKDGKRKVGDYKPRAPSDEGGHAYVKIDRGEVYGVRVFNDADYDAAVSLTIDGLSMFVACDKSGRDPKTNKPLYNHLIVPKKSSLLVRGWFVNLKHSDEFKVTEYAKSLAADLKNTGLDGLKSSGTVGNITACFHAAVPRTEKFPPGEPADKEYAFDASATGKGARFTKKYELVERKIGGLRAQVSVRYSK